MTPEQVIERERETFREIEELRASLKERTEQGDSWKYGYRAWLHREYRRARAYRRLLVEERERIAAGTISLELTYTEAYELMLALRYARAIIARPPRLADELDFGLRSYYDRCYRAQERVDVFHTLQDVTEKLPLDTEEAYKFVNGDWDMMW